VLLRAIDGDDPRGHDACVLQQVPGDLVVHLVGRTAAALRDGPGIISGRDPTDGEMNAAADDIGQTPPPALRRVGRRGKDIHLRRLLGRRIVVLRPLRDGDAVLAPDGVVERERGGAMPQHEHHRVILVLQAIAGVAGVQIVIDEGQRQGQTVGGNGIEHESMLAGNLIEPVIRRMPGRLPSSLAGLGLDG